MVPASNGESFVSIPQPVINWLFKVIQPVCISFRMIKLVYRTSILTNKTL